MIVIQRILDYPAGAGRRAAASVGCFAVVNVICSVICPETSRPISVARRRVGEPAVPDHFRDDRAIALAQLANAAVDKKKYLIWENIRLTEQALRLNYIELSRAAATAARVHTLRVMFALEISAADVHDICLSGSSLRHA